jgi:AraC family transcriptional regulator
VIAARLTVPGDRDIMLVVMRDRHPVYGNPIRKFSYPGFIVWETVYPANLHIPLHTHDEHAYLNLVVGGGYFESTRNRTNKCGPFSLAFHPPGAAHSNQFFNEESRLFNIRVDAAAFDELRDAPKHLYKPQYLNGRILAPASQLYEEFSSRGEVSCTAIERVVSQILKHSISRVHQRSTSPHWLERARELLHERFDQSLTIAELASYAGVHRVHFSRVFLQQFNCTVGQYRRFLRVERACRDLSITREPLSKIAQDCGFSDQAHLSRTIKSFTSLTPLTYRSLFSR